MIAFSKLFTRVLVAGTLVSVSFAAAALAEEPFERPTIGLSTSLQGSQLDFLFPAWLDRNVVIVPSIGLTSVDHTVKDVRLGLAVRYVFRVDKACPYAGVRGGILTMTPAHAGRSVKDHIVGVMAGGEYFFDRHLSVGVEAQLNGSISDENSLRFNNPNGTNINTATAAMLTFYF